MSATAAPTEQDRASVVIGAVLALLGAGLMWRAFDISLMPADQVMGPRLFPVVIGAGMALLGLASVVHGLRSMAPPPDPAAIHDRRGLLWVVAALPVLMLLVEPAGFVPAETALFALTARGFGSRRPMRDLALGFVLAALVYAGFVHGLGLQLPMGEWYDLLAPVD